MVWAGISMETSMELVFIDWGSFGKSCGSIRSIYWCWLCPDADREMSQCLPGRNWRATSTGLAVFWTQIFWTCVWDVLELVYNNSTEHNTRALCCTSRKWKNVRFANVMTCRMQAIIRMRHYEMLNKLMKVYFECLIFYASKIC